MSDRSRAVMRNGVIEQDILHGTPREIYAR